jgi:glycosyltransferase involved in cell wall biosynthesis
MKLTIGMACHQDYSGVFMTVNALRHYHDLSECEILVVDNAPNTKSGEEVRALLSSISEVPTKYVAYEEVTGAANAKNAVVQHASGDAVLVVDCHIILPENAISKLKVFYDDNPYTLNLYQGPMITHSLEPRHISTHLYPAWGSGMFGKWSAAWITDTGRFVQTVQNGDKLEVYSLMEFERVPIWDAPWNDHEKELKSWGWKLAIESDEPFEIPAQGMGLFTCRKQAWLGFNENFREFGGEEYYLQDKYRANGRKTYCLPWLKWHHRFYKESPTKYPNNSKTKFRNFVIGYNELEKDKTDLVAHFRTLLTQEQIDEVLSDPLKYEKAEPKQITELPEQKVSTETREDLYTKCAASPCGIEFYANHLRNIAAQCDTVTEISRNKETSVFLLAGNPSHLISYQEETHELLDKQKALLSAETHHETPIRWTLTTGKFPRAIPIKETDLLVINVEASAHRVEAELNKNAGKVKKHIAIARTVANGYAGEDSDKTQGLRGCILKFLNNNPEWFVFAHHTEQGGFTVLSKDESFRPTVPIHPWGVRCGVGQELSKLLKRFGFGEEEGCSCKSKAKLMDAHGADWCEANLETILGWLRDEHKRRKSRMPFIGWFARMLVRSAIKTVRDKQAKGGCE